MTAIAYLDICCFKRPFDDATAERVRREAVAVAAILEMAESGALKLVHSPAHDFENDRKPARGPAARDAAVARKRAGVRQVIVVTPDQVSIEPPS